MKYTVKIRTQNDDFYHRDFTNLEEAESCAREVAENPNNKMVGIIGQDIGIRMIKR